MISNMFLNLIYILFPLLAYFLYVVFEKTVGNKENDLWLDLALISIVYLLLKFGSFSNNIYNIILLNVVLIIAIYKRRMIVGLVPIFCFIYFYGLININYLMIYKYIILYLIFLVVNVDKFRMIIIFYVVNILFSIVGIIINTYPINILLYNVSSIFISYFIISWFDKTKSIIDLHITIKNLEKKKNLRNSLFKITHEIKNPIAVCKGYLDMLDLSDMKRIEKYIPIIKQEIDRTLMLMDDFLDLTRLKVNKSEVDISLLLEDTSYSVFTLLESKNVKFNYSTTCDELYLYIDYDRIKQVLINLIKNSLEAMDKEDGVISIEAICKPDKVVIKVIDNGKGMDKDTLKRVGDAFFSTKQHGTGLGVKLSKEVIELHGGKIKYASTLNVGTTVFITLPVNKC